ncbi:M56 family metallopeptidase [Bradyrhizobium daqingense]|uniref:Beta-lactamase regulating signal transducer with metallopeptidase domain n=1 Tax=Bradyrhizobium daqingense TaxID=993502 RepID=A0A562L8S0_9BRAD|nr:M56 family metallopeptidase [Bradyrhizobium daqingense]TWI04021.1 beta-lactamase regulating signal transducer with metallopeptidase domain [Bradyrhizobium daqingense]UFS91973.1 M56 family metallopeptidase [Bradyrhizobium daqingense]
MIATLAEAALRSFVLGGVVWFGLILCRVRNPHVQMTAWVVVLLASLAMPFVMHWPTLTITRPPLPMPAPADVLPADVSMLEMPQPALPIAPGAVIAPPASTDLSINWWLVATIVYAVVTACLVLRLMIGLCLTWRMARAATPMRGAQPIAADVRVSRDVGGPVTFGSTILVPPQFAGWDARKRNAVLAHEGAHVANRDFYVLLLASLNRAVFWFSPFAWWQLARLAELAEIISDARAIEMIDDRLSYAEILLDFASTVKPRPVELAMARASTVRARVERIIAATAMPVAVGWRKRLTIAAAIVPAVIVSAGMIAYRTPDLAPVTAELGEVPAQHYRPIVNFYAMGPASVFAIFREGDELYGQLTGQRKLRLTIGSDGIASYPASSGEITFPFDAERRSSELTLRMNGRDIRAVRVAEMPASAAEPSALDQYVGWYRVAPNRVLTVRRDGDRLQVEETVRGPAALLAEGADVFSIRGDNLLIFLRDEQAKVSRVLVQNAISGARLAPRIDAAVAQAIEADFARRVAQVPDRFREQVPVSGGKEMILRGIEDLRHGTPNYNRMSAPLAAKIHRQLSETQATFVALGALESIFFRGVGPGGYDIYGAKFENGTAEFRLLLEPDGKVGDVIFRADGNDELGGIVPCGEEANVRGRAGTSPIRIMLYNELGDDIQVFNLDAGGNRKAQSVVRPNMSWTATTTVNSPWVIADKSGRCLEVLMPGRQTRFHNVEATSLGARPGRAARRAVPIANGEEMLRRYIEGVGKGQPDYEHMTSEVADITRQQLPFDQAILARLGALRAVSFRGVTALDSDIYIAQFANGSAEWRIGVRNGTITKIALGPNF